MGLFGSLRCNHKRSQLSSVTSRRLLDFNHSSLPHSYIAVSSSCYSFDHIWEAQHFFCAVFRYITAHSSWLYINSNYIIAQLIKRFKLVFNACVLSVRALNTVNDSSLTSNFEWRKTNSLCVGHHFISFHYNFILSMGALQFLFYLFILYVFEHLCFFFHKTHS